MSHAGESAPTSHRQGGPRSEAQPKWTAFAVHMIADIAAGFVGLWIVLRLFGADQAVLFVQYVRDMAYWIAGWTENLSTVEDETLRLVLNYALPAAVYLSVGHGVAAKIRPTGRRRAHRSVGKARAGEPSPSQASPQ